MRAQSQIMRDSGYVTAAEAADAIGADSVGTIHRMVKTGRLKGARAGTRWYVSVKSLLLAHADAPPLVARIEALGVAPADEPIDHGLRPRRSKKRGASIRIDPPLQKRRRGARVS